MASEVQVANMAAILVGVPGNISSLDDDRTIARRLKAAWDMSRQAALRDGAWNFAKRRMRLAEKVVTADEKYPFAFAYEIPAESLRLFEVMDIAADRPSDRYRLEGRLILTNQVAPLPVGYTVDVPEPAYWDALFAETFAARLALSVGRSVAGGNFDHDRVAMDYKRLLAASRRVDARENPPIDEWESDWITARAGGSLQRRGVGGAW
jgi:hypothetical protein